MPHYDLRPSAVLYLVQYSVSRFTHHASLVTSDGGFAAAFGRGQLRLFLPDESMPEARQVFSGLEQSLEVEELRFAVGAMKVMHGTFGEAQAGVLKAAHHLDAD